MRTAILNPKLAAILATVLISVPVFLDGQTVEKIMVPVTQNGETLAFPFAGGLDAPQFSKADLNRDGVQDLFVFDRAGNVAIPFIHSGNPGTLEYTIDWSTLDSLPPISLWALMRDFNGDGVEDLFAATLHPGVQGIDLYRGSVVDGKLAFERMLSDDALGQFDLLYIEYAQGSFTPMYSAWGDVPAIEDVDGDGDLDILAFEPNGSYVHYARNRAVEKGLGPDTVDLVWDDICWGKFFESGISEAVSLSTNPNQCASFGGIPALRHAGSTLQAYDHDGDGDLDLLVGDLASSTLVFLTNGGDSQKAYMTSQETMFPAETPVDIEYFVAPFILDVDNDGLDDLVAASNDKNFSENYHVAWFYRNTGSEGAPDYTFVQSDLFVGEMLDFGWISKPAVMDVDGDGLQDILIGTGGYYNAGSTDARLVYLRNTGTAQAPAFNVEDTDFLQFSAFNSIPTWEFAPAAGDLDGDGDIDLIVGERNGSLIYAENIADPGAPPEFAELDYPYADINVGAYSTPAIVDLNGDGLADIVVGERIGNNDNAGKCSNLNYFQNVGTEGDPQFVSDPTQAPNTQCLGRVIFNTQPGLAEFSAPEFYRTEGGLQMMTGSETGLLRVYSNVDGNTEGAFALEDMNFGGIRDGYRTVPELADIDDDGLYELILGNGRGGLTLYNTSIAEVKTSVSDPADVRRNLSIFPNPAAEHIVIANAEGQIDRVVAIDLIGRRIPLDRMSDRMHSVRNLVNGAYVIFVYSDRGVFAGKLVVSR